MASFPGKQTSFCCSRFVPRPSTDDTLGDLCRGMRRWQYKSTTSVDGDPRPWHFTEYSLDKEGDGQACPGGSSPAQYSRAKRLPATTNDEARPSQEASTAMRVRPRSGKGSSSPKTRARIANVEPAYVFAPTTSAKTWKTLDIQHNDANIQSPTQGASTPRSQVELDEEMGSTTPRTAHSAAGTNPKNRHRSGILLRQQYRACRQDKGAVLYHGTRPVAVLAGGNVEAAGVESAPPLRKSSDTGRGSKLEPPCPFKTSSFPPSLSTKRGGKRRRHARSHASSSRRARRVKARKAVSSSSSTSQRPMKSSAGKATDNRLYIVN